MIIIIGKSGQLAQALVKHLVSTEQYDYKCFGRDDIDVMCMSDINEKLGTYNVSSIINASAYTAVDKAETDIAGANSLNCAAVKNLAIFAKQNDAYFLHISTDYVFSGDQNTPYLPDTKYKAINEYGRSKMLGEKALLDVYPSNSAILRTSWVYSEFGNNFVKSMLRLMNERDELNIVFDQIGSPTSADTLANVCLNFVQQQIKGVHHACDLGVTSWYDFAQVILRMANELKLLKRKVKINPIPSSAYPTPTARPHYSVLDTTSTRNALNVFELPYWQDALYTTLQKLKQDS